MFQLKIWIEKLFSFRECTNTIFFPLTLKCDHFVMLKLKNWIEKMLDKQNLDKFRYRMHTYKLFFH